MPPLIELIRAVPETPEYPPEAVSIPINAITSDSRQVKPGTLFVALKGTSVDATQFIGDAKKAGAAAILCAPDTVVKEEHIPIIRAKDPRRALALMAADLYGRQPEHMVAVTGTDGKTSTVDFFRQMAHLAGHSSASIGTLGALDAEGRELAPGINTTPDPVGLHRLLAEMAHKGVTHAAMEASSHGLDQSRLDGVKLQAAAFTNLTRDHLDYHKNDEAYFKAKARLFDTLLPQGATMAVNRDDMRYAELEAIALKRGLNLVGFGKAPCEFQLLNSTLHGEGQTVSLLIYGRPMTLEIPLVGSFQAMNILAALALLEAVGVPLDTALLTIPDLKGVPGRLELAARLKNGASVYVDYAHTPMALANILKTLRPHTKGKLHVVFGCGGDRDPGKRPQMGKAAAELADEVIVTDDNPRSEDPAAIRKAVLAAAPKATEIGDRREAIASALKKLGASDILVIAGKGHEKTQTIGSTVMPFDDVSVAKELAR